MTNRAIVKWKRSGEGNNNLPAYKRKKFFHPESFVVLKGKCGECQKSKDLDFFSTVGGTAKNSNKDIFFTSMNFDVVITISP